jgi:DUF4097 and DUF4098 domain-containing protein YvlB
MIMNKRMFGMTLGLLALIALVACNRAAEKYEEKFAKTEALAKDGRVFVSNMSGSIDVRSWDQAQVKIEADKISSASSAEKAKANADLVTIEVTKDGNNLRIETKYPSGHNSGLSVSINYRIWVPDKAAVKLRNVSGAVRAEAVGGAFEADVTSGNLTVAKMAGPVDCRTVSGKVSVEDVGNDADLKTVSGGITASRIKGSVDAETTSGRIELRDISGAKTVRAKVLSGNITYDGQLASGTRITLEALSGNLDLTLPATSAFELNAETFSGHVDSEFAITMSGKLSPKELRGVVGNGGATLRLKTFSGSIRLKKK